jgi:Tfp pilus assembly protein PilE
VPVPLIGELRPSAASSVGYLFIASDDSLIREVLAVKSGKKPGLKSTAEFKHVSQGLPDRGNQFVFVSQRFAETMMQVQQQVIAANAKAQPAMAQWMQSVNHSQSGYVYSVGMNTSEGCFTIGNSSQGYASSTLLAPVAVVGLLSAIAIPNFVKARATSQQNACINNLRQIDAAKNEWMLEKGKKTGDMPTADDIRVYLIHNQLPACPAGGTYTIGAVGESPACSVPGHKLP